MKKIYIVFFSLALIFTSCDSWIDEEVNIDPNNPIDVQLNQMLTSTQAAYAYLSGGDLGRYNSLFTQHHAGVERQHAGIDTYGFTESDVNNSYGTLYSGVMQDLSVMIDKAGGENPSPQYRGLAKTMMAMVLMQVTDLFNDMPYSQAFQGNANLSPAYDTQESIYNSVQTLLSDGLADLQGDAGTFSIGSEDIFYGGNIDNWIALNRTLKARAYVHLGARNSANYQNALDEIDAGGITSGAQNASVSFSSGANQNPWFQFMDQRGDIRMGAFFIDFMVAEGDPRLPVIADTIVGGTYAGSPAGTPDLFASSLLYLNNETRAQTLVSYAEAKFIEAEAAFQTGDPQRAADAHNAAVLASLADYGVSDAAFEAAHAAQTSGSITLEEIMSQKYVAMYGNPESYTDWRRTGIPALQVAANAQVPSIPTRWPYPQDERLYNTSYPGNAQLTEKVWWDQ
ncbi:MAG: SusD/RagB family nutrient-binding outer membrane lipoprotein [Bacteroidota bacterium]